MSELTLTPGKLYKSLVILSGFCKEKEQMLCQSLNCPVFMLLDIKPVQGETTKFEAIVLIGKQTYSITLWEASIDKYIRSIP